LKILVIGGTGFLGSHLVPKLVEEQHQVTVLTRQKHLANSNSTNNIGYLNGDILNPKDIESSVVLGQYLEKVYLKSEKTRIESLRRINH
jgi:nucleoside-diphosphate-sugar epimerase